MAAAVEQTLSGDGFSCAVSGTVVTLGCLAGYTAGEAIGDVQDAIGENSDVDTGDEIYANSIGTKQYANYASIEEYTREQSDIDKIALTKDMTLYVHWGKVATTGSFTVGAPICGTQAKMEYHKEGEEDESATYQGGPVVTADADSQFDLIPTLLIGYSAAWSESANLMDDEPFTGTIAGGSSYYAVLFAMPKQGYVLPNSVPGGVQPLDPNAGGSGASGGDTQIDATLPTITVNGQAAEVTNAGGVFFVVLKMEAVHAWDAGVVTKAATEAAEGVRTFTCTGGCGTTKTEAIPKVVPSKQQTAKKASNPMKVKAKKVTVKAKKLAKRAQKVAAKKAFNVTGAKGAVTFKAGKISCKKKLAKQAKKKIKLAKSGKLTLKKGLKKGAYKVKVTVTAAGDASYNALSKTVTLKLVVK